MDLYLLEYSTLKSINPCPKIYKINFSIIVPKRPFFIFSVMGIQDRKSCIAVKPYYTITLKAIMGVDFKDQHFYEHTYCMHR